MIEKIIATLLTKKGLLYGFGIGLMKVMKDIRDGKVSWSSALTDLLGATIIAHASYEVISLTDLPELFKVAWMVFLAANAFLVISILSDKELFNRIAGKYLKRYLDDES